MSHPLSESSWILHASCEIIKLLAVLMLKRFMKQCIMNTSCGKKCETTIYTKCIIMHTLLTLAVSDAFTESLRFWFKFLTNFLWSCSRNLWATQAMCVNMWTRNGNAVVQVWTNLYKGSRTPLVDIISLLSCTSYLLNNRDCEVFHGVSRKNKASSQWLLCPSGFDVRAVAMEVDA